MTTKELLAENEIRSSVLGGKEGWLFLYSGANRQFDYLTGIAKPSVDIIFNLEAVIAERKRAAENIGAEYVHIIMPSKPVCCANRLPNSLQAKVESVYYSCFQDNLSDYAKGLLMYPARQLSDNSFFKRLDTHPNDLGSFAAAQLILDRFGLGQMPSPDFVNKECGGDLAVMLGHNSVKSLEPVLPSAFFDNLCIDDNKALLKVGTNTGHMTIVSNLTDCSGRKLLICGDSFTVGLLPIIAQSFETVFYVRGPIFPYSIVQDFSPTHIVSATAERYMPFHINDLGGQCPIQRAQQASWFGHHSSIRYFIEILQGRHKPSCNYQLWRERVLKCSLQTSDIGIGVANKMIKCSAKNWKYISTGSDPFFIFDNANVKSEGTSIVLIISTQAECKARLYYSEHAGSSFTEEHSQGATLNKGINRVRFTLPSAKNWRRIRLDPVNTSCGFNILSVDVIPQGNNIEAKSPCHP
jgi:hypothetical protein